MTSGGTNDPNKLNHIFANPNHNLDALVQQFGSRRSAGRAIFEAVDQGYRGGRLILDAFGRYEQLFDIGGYPVMVRGRIVNGLVRIGTAWIPRHPWGWSAVLGALTRAPRRLVEAVFLPPWKHEGNNA